jgi:predicted MFS family arabinose efflux permease
MPAKRSDGAALFLLGVLAFWANGDNYAAAPLLVEIASDFGVGIGTAALSVTSYMLFFGLLTIIFGPLGDRFGRSRILKAAAFGSAAFSMLSALVWDLPSLIAVRAFNGAFSAGIMPLAVAYAGETAAPGEQHQRIGKVMGMMFLGGAMATAIGGAVSQFGSWKDLYFLYGAAELLTALPLAFLLRDAAVGGEPSGQAGGMAASYKDVFANSLLVKTIGLLFFIGFATMGAFAYLGKYVQEGTGMSILLVGTTLSAYGIGTLLGGRIAARIKAAIGDRIFLAAGLAGGAALVALGLAVPWPPLAVPALFVYGLAFVCIQSSIVSSAQAMLPSRRGAVMSAASFTMVVSGALGTYVNGRVIAATGFAPLFVAAGACFVIAGIAAAALGLKKAPVKAVIS